MWEMGISLLVHGYVNGNLTNTHFILSDNLSMVRVSEMAPRHYGGHV